MDLRGDASRNLPIRSSSPRQFKLSPSHINKRTDRGADASSTSSPMSIPRSSRGASPPPPPLPPPRHIKELTEYGQDHAWHYANNDGLGSALSSSVAPGSSLSGGGQFRPFRPTERKVDMLRDEPGSRRGFSAVDGETRIPDLASLLAFNKSMGERQSERQSGREAYDRSLLQRIGGPGTPPRSSGLSSSQTSYEEATGSFSRPGSLLSTVERRHSSNDVDRPGMLRTTGLSPSLSGLRSPLSDDGYQPRRSEFSSDHDDYFNTSPGRHPLSQRDEQERPGQKRRARSPPPSSEQPPLNDPRLQLTAGDWSSRQLGITRGSVSGAAARLQQHASSFASSAATSSVPRSSFSYGSSYAPSTAPSSYSEQPADRNPAFGSHEKPCSRDIPPQASLNGNHNGLHSAPHSAPHNVSLDASHSGVNNDGHQQREDSMPPPPPAPPSTATSQTLTPSAAIAVGTATSTTSTTAPVRRDVGGVNGTQRAPGLWICDCCPKKPKKFETKEDLESHTLEKQYPCNYCHHRFKNKNEAERHQNSLHLRKHSWSCAALTAYDMAFHPTPSSLSADGSPSLLVRPRDDAKTDSCGYCGIEFRNPPNWPERVDHLNHAHKFGECNQSKKFYRADHFRQHLKHSHAGTSGKWTNVLETACMKDEPIS